MEDSIRILIVEDEALIAENLRLTLEDLGYAALEPCYTFAEAAAALPTTEADLVILDINLGSARPQETGLELAAFLPEGKSFLFLSAYSELGIIRKATKLRPAGYLIKPVNPASLFAAIQTAIEATMQETAPAPQPLLEAHTQPDFFFVKVGSSRHRVNWEDVFAIESGRNYVTLRSQGIRSQYAIRGSITFVIDQLLPARLRDQFLRIGRSTAVNRAYITTFDATSVVCGGERFENTRLSAKQFKELTEGATAG